MANLISSIGYSLGKLHSGMIAYLCELHREGNTGPLEAFFEKLGVAVPRHPVARREWNSVDLAIFSGDDPDHPQVLIEMKVDDHDHWTTKKVAGKKTPGYQTVLYADMCPSCIAYLYVTLGMGEYYHAPRGRQFDWVRIRRLLAALDAIAGANQAIRDWRDAVRNEVDLQDRVRCNDRTHMDRYRAGAWNIYFLGYLKESFEEGTPSTGDATCYPWGSAPDTILNFGWCPRPAYLEINNNGSLNLKISLETFKTDEDKRQAVQDLQDRVARIYPPGTFELRNGGRMGKSKTVASFDIALRSPGGALEFERTQEETLRRLQEIVSPLAH